MSSKTYEHLVLELDAANMTVVGADAPLQDVLSERGRAGWELISAVPSGKAQQVLMFFKRKTRLGKH